MKFRRYSKFLVALAGALAAIYGPDAGEALIALLTAVGVYAVPNAE